MQFNIEKFSREIMVRKDFVDDCLQQYLAEEDTFPPVIHKAIRYAVFNGGKRLRPIMVMEGAILAGGSREQVVPMACALEMIHCYSLVHDDLPAMDNDDFRRGKPTCHRVYGEANAILTGDALLTAAFLTMTRNQEMPGVDPVHLLRAINEVARAAGSQGMIGGQVLDLEAEDRTIDYEELKVLHRLKTGELFRASLRAGAILCGMNEEGLAALEAYACHFGLAFQITDDILDVKGEEALLGKPVGSDARNQKTTYPALFGLERSRQLAEESVQNCLTSLQPFGTQATFLCNLALFTLHRNS